MPEPKVMLPDLGRHSPDDGDASLRLSRYAAGGLSAVWVLAVVLYLTFGTQSNGTGTLGLMMTLLLVFLPLALIWVAISTLGSIRSLRADAARLQASVDAMRLAYVAGQQASGAAAAKPSVEKKLDEIVASQKQAESALASFTSRRDAAHSVASADGKAALAAPRPAFGDEEPGLALGTPAEELRAPLSISDFVRALQFPENADDRDGFRALRHALEDRKVAKLIRAAQDVLTLLSQEGIYMDDLTPDRARPEIWRKFANGERGRPIAGLGGVRDRSSLALTASRMREDTVFRDAGHHFLRTFDKTFAEFEKNASDSDLADMAETRTARAFMLFGRVTGTFD